MGLRALLVLAFLGAVVGLQGGASAQPCVVTPGDVTLPLACPAGPYTSPGVTFTPKPVEPPIPPAEGNAIDACAPGAFCRLAGTKITDLPLPTKPPGTRAYITAYSGAAFDTKRGCLMVAGGGHNDYGGNEVVALCVGEATLAWKLLSPPSPVIPPQQTACSAYGNTYADGKPASRHTYAGLTYLPDQDALLLLGGLKWCAAGDGVKPVDAWRLNLGSGQWQQMALPPLPTAESIRSAYDPATVSVYANCWNGNCTLRRYDPATDTWATLPGSSAYGAYATTLDPKRGLMVYLGLGSTTAGISTQSLVTGQRTTRTLSGDPIPPTAAKGGIAYDPVADRVLVWAGGLELYEVDLDANTARRITATGITPGPASDAGTYGRWAYAPSKDVFLLVTSGSAEASVYKPVRSAPIPPPPSTFLMAVATAGSGHGTVTGTGLYAASATVPLSATPDASSFFDGWTPAECANNPFTMPPRAMSCTAAFALKPPVPPQPPSSGGTLVPGTFLYLASPSSGGPPRGSKHVTATYRPDNQRIYLKGGDYQDAATAREHAARGWAIPDDSYRQETYSFDLAARLAGGPDAGWQRIEEYCQPDLTGGVAPKKPDFIGWTWDAGRKVFWFVPGLTFLGNKACPGLTGGSEADDPGYKHSHVMSYAPDEPDLSKRWTDVSADQSLPHDSWASFYDPVADALVRMGHHGGNGGEVHIFDIATKTWTRKPLETAATGSLRLMRSLPCVDLPNRRAFIGDPWSGKWWRYNMDARTVTAIPPIPGGRQMDKNEEGQISADVYTYAAWRPSLKECWVWRNDLNTLLVYQSDTNTWREEPWTTQIAGGLPRVLHAITWHAGLDALVFLGNRTAGSTGIWVYKPR